MILYAQSSLGYPRECLAYYVELLCECPFHKQTALQKLLCLTFGVQFKSGLSPDYRRRRIGKRSSSRTPQFESDRQLRVRPIERQDYQLHTIFRARQIVARERRHLYGSCGQLGRHYHSHHQLPGSSARRHTSYHRILSLDKATSW